MNRRLPPLLRERDFALYWWANLTRVLAMQMVAVAVGWQVYAVRHHPFDIGLVGLAEFVPLPLLALPTGQLADRISRRFAVAVSLVVALVDAVLLLVVTIGGAHQVWPFIALGVLSGVALALGTPSARAMTPELVAPGEGTISAVVAGGAATIAVAALWLRLFPSLSRLDRPESLLPDTVP